MNNPRPTTVTMAFGVVVFVATLIAWLYGESVAHVDTTIVWAIAGPIILALFVGQQIGEAKSAAQLAANQTNGMLDARIKAGAAAALAERDAARTHQAQASSDAASASASGDSAAG